MSSWGILQISFQILKASECTCAKGKDIMASHCLDRKEEGNTT